MENEDSILAQIIKQIKNKKELAGLDNKVVENTIFSYLKNKNIQISKLISLSPHDKKLIIKEIRADLRLLHGRFQASKKSKKNILKKQGIESLLQAHSSTKERIEDYEKIKSVIASLKIKSVLDLGCGLNPIALASQDITYYASDINNEEISLIKSFFDQKKIAGDAFIYDLREKDTSGLPSADLCLVFKVLDIFKNKREIALHILTRINCKFFLISFSTKKLSGKAMNSPRRLWFESIVKNLSLSSETFETSNEIFYLIKK